MLKNISLSISALLLSISYVTPWDSAQAVSKSPRLVAAKPAATTHPTPKNFSGNVSWYGVPFNGKKTASGKIFDMNKCTSAHLHLPFFTRVMVEDPKNGKSVIVKVLDRGPYAKGRVMDLSREAAKRLGTLGSGVSYVECTVLSDDDDDGGAPADAKSAPAKTSSPPTADKK